MGKHEVIFLENNVSRNMHLGEEDSLLTNLKVASTDPDPTQPSPVMKKLVECLKYLISINEDKGKKPTLILNGDILELALVPTIRRPWSSNDLSN